MLRLVSREGPSYQFLDAAQLIKHALGLMRAAAKPTTLLYLYWEPMDAGLSPLFDRHRAEIADFADRVAGSSLKFTSMSYPELWDAWDETGDPFLRGQVAALRARYEVPAWAWECVEWRDGRLRSASFLDELLRQSRSRASGGRRHHQAGHAKIWLVRGEGAQAVRLPRGASVMRLR